MSHQVQELIDKIKSEGIQEADKQAKSIADEAQKNAQRTVDEAKRQADQLIIEAKEEIKKMKEAAHAALKQASRDMLLSLRKEIGQTLDKIVLADVGDALSGDQLAQVLNGAVEKAVANKSGDEQIEVLLSESDLSALNCSVISKLKTKVKDPITFKASEGINKGFTISYDAGKSSFDFTDESLAEFLSVYLNEQVGQLLKGSIETEKV